MSHSIGPQPWMTWPQTTAVLDALEASGGPGCARFVGGCVRDSVLGRPVGDIDIATPLTPQEVTEALRAARLKAVPTGIEHGTVTAVSGGRGFEITTLRRDVSTDGRRAVVAFTDDWAKDAQRRDFTLNALYADRQGAIFDASGRGVEDARAGRIVFMGQAERRILEDHLRILRFFRFLAWFGRGEPDAEALVACTTHRQAIANLAAERISAELIKLLAADDPRAAVKLMAETGVLAIVLPEAADSARFEALVAIEAGAADPVLRLAALLPDDPALARSLAERLRLSNGQRERIAAALGQDPPLTAGMTPHEARRALYKLGPQAFRDRARLAWARAGGDSAAWRRLAALPDVWRAPKLPVDGEAVVGAGVPRGPLVGQALRAVEAWWIEQDFPDDPDAVVETLKAVARDLAR